jgi:hypothetical protein
MALHARQVAVAAGAPTELVAAVASQLVNENNIRMERAIAIMSEWSEK